MKRRINLRISCIEPLAMVSTLLATCRTSQQAFSGEHKNVHAESVAFSPFSVESGSNCYLNTSALSFNLLHSA